MNGSVIAAARLDQAQISGKTVWSFVRLATEDGRVGVGEASLPSGHETLRRAADAWLGTILGARAERHDVGERLVRSAGLADAALTSALDMALFDLEGQSQGLPVYQLLGAPEQRRIELYANINRRILDRSPTGFVESATAAVQCGFPAIKIAPFDEITATDRDDQTFQHRLELGLARVAATRRAIGDASRLRIDCHWRFTYQTACALIEAIAPLKPDWVECPLLEKPENAAAIADVRRRANAAGMRLAGLEMGTSVSAFEPYLTARCYDVIMPDAKYIGGLRSFAALNALAARHGAVLSPHNPTGPICHAASLHLCTSLPEVDSLEVQFDETPYFAALQKNAPLVTNLGWSKAPERPGLGVTLNDALIDKLRIGDPPA